MALREVTVEHDSFYSILFPEPQDGPKSEARSAPECFRDLNLDRIVAALTAGREHYDLQPLFYAPLSGGEDIRYRQDVLRDLEDDRVRSAIGAFAAAMGGVRAHLAQAQALRFALQKQRWLLDAVQAYCDAVAALMHDLTGAPLGSRGLMSFREYLARLTESAAFAALARETDDVRARLSSVHYAIVIRGQAVTVRKYAGEPDYSDDVLTTFERFKQGAVKDYRVEFSDAPQMNQVEEKILGLVAQLYPETFQALAAYCAAHGDFVDGTIARFEREIQFYAAYLEYVEPLRRTGLPFCYPDVSTAQKDVCAGAAFDLALAATLCSEGAPVVCNGFRLEGPERIIVVSGPNQGGKSTFARMFGQLHYLARLGLMVPGQSAKLFLCDDIFAHFEREEDITAERGKLEDDLLRIHSILRHATTNSVVILNEIFTSTALRDAVTLSKKIMDELIRLDVLCVWVTFIDELASYGRQTVSMTSTVKPDNLAERTYKIVRQPASGRAYALSIAQKHGLSYALLKERIRP